MVIDSPFVFPTLSSVMRLRFQLSLAVLTPCSVNGTMIRVQDAKYIQVSEFTIQYWMLYHNDIDCGSYIHSDIYPSDIYPTMSLCHVFAFPASVGSAAHLTCTRIGAVLEAPHSFYDIGLLWPGQCVSMLS